MNSALTDKEPSKIKVPVYQPTYTGNVLELYKIFLVNVLLNICTLGIYSFWGKTRIRKYMASQTVLAGNRMEYTGTGKELFIGFLKAILIYWPVSFAMNVPEIYIFGLIGFFCLISLAMYMALRYRLSRTRWKGIRFAIAGHAGEFLKIALKRTLWNFVTLGYKVAQSDIVKWTYIANFMSFGKTNFKFQGDEKKIQSTNLKTMGIIYAYTLITFIPLVFSLSDEINSLKKAVMEKPKVSIEKIEKTSPFPDENYPKPEPAPKETDLEETKIISHDAVFAAKSSFKEDKEIIAIIYGLGWSLSIFLVWWAARQWYQAALWREQFRGVTINDIRFKCALTGGGLLWLKTSNLVMIILTLGLIMPFIYQRNLRYYLSCIKLGGDVNQLHVDQVENTDPDGTGDSLADDFGVDIGF
ncbi:MAG TPA: DUF898 family protein [Alphaproteobacteria bacterium]|nr:DUF898 domain-containing protein [Alphaproteobacteria bacterium]HOO50317.1 DUF898 family protein [Alphaproteobacteria bacterium]